MTTRFIEVRQVELASLEPFPGNPRRGNVGEIRKSLRRLGQYRSLVVRVIDGHMIILAGNHTSKAMALEGWTEARAELVECDDDEARRINAADNRLGELPSPETGERYDPESLAELLSSFDGDYEGTGWAEEDLQALLADDEPEPVGGGHLRRACAGRAGPGRRTGRAPGRSGHPAGRPLAPRPALPPAVR